MIGKKLGNRYEIVEKVGEGGMAIVYKAKCHLLNRYVAIKVLKDEFTDDEQFIGKFRRESQAAASLSHPNIVNIYDVGAEKVDDKEVYYIVMELIEGKTLKELIVEKGKLTADETIKYSLQIGEALQIAHKNHIIHRDIKPHNIMITNDGRIKVTDFGIARAVTTSTVTTTSNALGSVHYFSPEQARGGYTDEKSDIYSLGIVMYEMITGKVPYDAESPITVALKHIQDDIVPPSQIDVTIPKNLEAIIMKCVEKRQSDRYNNASDLIRDLKAIDENVVNANTGFNNDTEYSTRIIPVIDIKEEDDDEEDTMASQSERRRNNKKNYNEKKEKSKGGNGVVFLGILLAFLVVTGLFFGYGKLKESLSSNEIVVENILGMQEDEAKELIESLGLEFEVTGRFSSSEFEEGEVMTQSEKEGTVVKEGYPIKVTVSTGHDLVVVPSVMNKTLEEAKDILSEKGLTVGSVDPKFSDTVSKGQVMEQDPEPFEEVADGSRVNLVVSEGPETLEVAMPNVVDRSIEEARSMITGKGLVIGDVKFERNENVDKNIVTWQSIVAGTILEEGTTIDLYVSSGPPEEPEEPEEPERPVQVPTPITLTPLPDRDETNIRIIKVENESQTEVYNETVPLSEGSFTKVLYGKEGARYDIFYDDAFQGSFPPQR